MPDPIYWGDQLPTGAAPPKSQMRPPRPPRRCSSFRVLGVMGRDFPWDWKIADAAPSLTRPRPLC